MSIEDFDISGIDPDKLNSNALSMLISSAKSSASQITDQVLESVVKN